MHANGYFSGENILSVDAKGRMTIPSKYRDALTQLVITHSPLEDEPCLLIYSMAQWKKILENMAAQPGTKKIRRLRRLFLGKSVEYVVDSQGRVLLTPTMRKFAGIDKKVAMVGLGEKIEVWDKAKWDAINGNADDDVEQQEFEELVELLI